MVKFYTDNIYFFSDFHAKHSKSFILEPRGFKDADEGLNIVIKNWNEKVPTNAIAFLLGDTVVGAGRDSHQVFNDILNSLNFSELYIMPGNHNAGFRQCFEANYNTGKIDSEYKLTFSLNGGNKLVHLIPNYFEIFIQGYMFVLSHYPILSYNGLSKDTIHIFGHSHSNLKNSPIGREYLKGRVIEVCPESTNNLPLSFKEILSVMSNKKSLEIDHHGQD